MNNSQLTRESLMRLIEAWGEAAEMIRDMRAVQRCGGFVSASIYQPAINKQLDEILELLGVEPS